ncbi:hypothetical protein MY04_3430 [Flammeovirga sp. MY04]|uniref:tetratricopeptide repeat protein n=1 Tax=Flammeovirga sp. MY04 TaxID=1191459 RepID=UPI00130541FD|nr:hypothetical protein [Flammeovirga sp. MY04]ANQ50784.2 hypothetical protein MY04_3430 [Flammeovirga sp. MY04]
MNIRSTYIIIYSFVLLFPLHLIGQSSSSTQERLLKLTRISINENRCHDALNYLDSLENVPLSKEGEMETFSLRGKAYSLLALEENCRDSSNFDICSDYAEKTVIWFEKILNYTQKDELFHIYAQAELNRFYDNLITEGAAEFIKNNTQSASFFFRQAIYINHTDPIILRYSMIASELNQDFEKALEYSDMLLEVNYDSVEVYESRAFYYENLKNPKKAIQEVDKGLEKYPLHYSLVYRGLGICVREHWYNKGLSLILPLVKKFPSDEKALMNIGMLYESLEKPDLAMLYYTRAINVSPTRLDAYLNISQLQFMEAVKIQKVIMNWSTNKQKEKYKNIHKSELRKKAKFYLNLTYLNAKKAYLLDKENKDALTTYYNASLLLNRSKELKELEESLEVK